MKICCKRGTSSIDIDIAKMPWSGKGFMEFQKEKMASLPRSKTLGMFRGTKMVSVEKYPESRRRFPESGYSLVQSRGTRILRL